MCCIVWPASRCCAAHSLFFQLLVSFGEKGNHNFQDSLSIFKQLTCSSNHASSCSVLFVFASKWWEKEENLAKSIFHSANGLHSPHCRSKYTTLTSQNWKCNFLQINKYLSYLTNRFLLPSPIKYFQEQNPT